MKTLFIECKMGAAGDMLTAALLELFPEEKRNEIIKSLQNIGLEGVEFTSEKMVKCGIQGTHVHVFVNGKEEGEEHHHHHEEEHHHHEHDYHDENNHHHYHMSDILHTVNDLKIPESVKKDVIDVYNIIAQAESHAHGVKVEEIHFHEVGNKDAIMDITAVCYLINQLGVGNILCSPIHVGSGQVKCSHGIMPVPAPATEFILRNIPYYQGNIKSELCTPTGAALLKHFAKDFGPQPMMKIEKVGVGCGKKDFEAANCVRVFLGETVEQNSSDRTIKLDANVDDMTAEELGFAMDRLFEAGAKEVFTSPVYMKKNRPGTLITILCSSDDIDVVIQTLFKHTTTIGVRQTECDRYVQKREIVQVETEFGPIRKKVSTGYGTTKEKFEYDDLAKIALEKNMSIREILQKIQKN